MKPKGMGYADLTSADLTDELFDRGLRFRHRGEGEGTARSADIATGEED
jgi:hypothetical protein